MTSALHPSRLTAWLDQWHEIVPLLVAEFVVWLGFGGLLPILPIYFTEQGVDLATLGLVIAAWPAARLVSEPIFGWIADRTARVPLMVIGLVATGIFGALPLVLTSPLAFVLLRARRRAQRRDLRPGGARVPDRRDAAGQARRGVRAVRRGADGRAADRAGDRRRSAPTDFGGIGFVFIFSAVAAIVSAVLVALRVHETPGRTKPGPAPDSTEFPPDSASLARRARRGDVEADRERAADAKPPSSLWNRGLIAVIVINAGGYYAGGTYEVIWSLFLTGLGADLAYVGFTFAMFGLPVLLLSPIAGKIVDRRGSFAFIIIGSILPAVTGILYTLLPTYGPAVLLILVEATGFAFLNPALYSVVAANTPPGRSSTAQGLFGAAGTLGFIVASLGAGVLAERNILLPFYVFSAVLMSSLVIGLAIGGQRLRTRPAPVVEAAAAEAAEVPTEA